MNQLQIAKLSVNQIPAYDLEQLKLYSRLRNGDIAFTSIPDALSGIDIVLNNKPINPDKVTLEEIDGSEDLIRINIIDNGICTLINQLYLYKNKELLDEIKVLSDKIDDLISNTKNIHNDTNSTIILTLSTIRDLGYKYIELNQNNQKYHTQVGSIDPANLLARRYYGCMLAMFKAKKHKTAEDFKRIDYYKEIISGKYVVARSY